MYFVANTRMKSPENSKVRPMRAEWFLGVDSETADVDWIVTSPDSPQRGRRIRASNLRGLRNDYIGKMHFNLEFGISSKRRRAGHLNRNPQSSV